MTLREALKPYTDVFGLIHPVAVGETKAPTSMNGLSYLSFYIVLQVASGAIRIEDCVQLNDAIQLCRMPGTWILSRYPKCKDQQSWDDLTSVAAALTAVSIPYIGRNMLAEYEARYWYVPTELHEGATKYRHADGSINWCAYLGRFPQLRFMAALAAARRPSLLLQLLWSLGLVLSAHAKTTNQRGEPVNQTGYRMSYVMAVAYLTQIHFESWICTKAASYFLKRVKNLYATQRGYFAETHPFMEHLKKLL